MGWGRLCVCGGGGGLKPIDTICVKRDGTRHSGNDSENYYAAFQGWQFCVFCQDAACF